MPIKIEAHPSATGIYTLTNPNGSTARGITLPDADTTLVGTDATQTLTNKTIQNSVIQGGVITQGVAQASTSGTAIDFTGIPSWAKRVTILFSGVSLTSTDNILVQAIIGGSLVTSGYSSVTGLAAANFNQTSTAGFVIYAPNTAGVFYGAMRLHNISGNTWVEEHSGGQMGPSNAGVVGGGVLAAAGALTGVRITVSGVNTFDAGTINIMYEG